MIKEPSLLNIRRCGVREKKMEEFDLVPITNRKNGVKRKLVTAIGLVISIGATCILLPNQEKKTIAANSIKEKGEKSILTEQQDQVAVKKLVKLTPVKPELIVKKTNGNEEQSEEKVSFNHFEGPYQQENHLKADKETESIKTYIEKLRADLVELREQYQQENEKNHPTEKIANQLNNPVFLYAQVVDLNTQETITTQSQLIGTSNQSENINTIIGTLGTTGEPELPPLFPPEHYLPDYIPEEPVFNGYIWPAKGTFTSGYGWRRGRMHKGIDIAAPIGTPIVAAAPGEVIYAGWNSGGFGNLVKVKHPDGNITLYAHNSRIVVRQGQQVKQGQQIATMGSTGRSTGPHLHFEIHPGGQGAVNPMAYLR